MLSKAKTQRENYVSLHFLLMLFIFIIGRLVAYYYTTLTDDAYITFRYAVNLVEGKGFVFQEGERLLSTTAPLFGLFCAAIYALGFNLVQTIPLTSIVFDSVSLFLIYSFFLKEQDDVLKAIFCCLLMAVPTMQAGISGMESSLFVCMILLAFLCAAKEKHVISGLIAAASVFIRPEGILVAATVSAQLLFKKEYKKLLEFCLAMTVVLLPVLLVFYYYYGSVIPHSLTVKSGHIFANVPDWKPSAAYYFLYYNKAIIILSILSFLGLRRVFASQQTLLRYISVFAALYLFSYLVGQPWVFLWYVFPYHVVACVWAAFGVHMLLQKYALLRPFNNGYIFLFLGLLFTAYTNGVLRDSTYENGKVKDKWHEVVGKKLQQFCDARRPESILTMCDLGQVSYYCKHTHFYDMCGLASKESLQLQQPDAVVRLLNAKKPDYIAFFPYKDDPNNKRRFDLIPKDKYQPIFEIPYSDKEDILSATGGGLIFFERIR